VCVCICIYITYIGGEGLIQMTHSVCKYVHVYMRTCTYVLAGGEGLMKKLGARDPCVMFVLFIVSTSCIYKYIYQYIYTCIYTYVYMYIYVFTY